MFFCILKESGWFSANINLTIEDILLYHLVDYVYVNDRQSGSAALCNRPKIDLNLCNGDTLCLGARSKPISCI